MIKTLISRLFHVIPLNPFFTCCQVSGSVERADFSQMTGTRSGYLRDVEQMIIFMYDYLFHVFVKYLCKTFKIFHCLTWKTAVESLRSDLLCFICSLKAASGNSNKGLSDYLEKNKFQELNQWTQWTGESIVHIVPMSSELLWGAHRGNLKGLDPMPLRFPHISSLRPASPVLGGARSSLCLTKREGWVSLALVTSSGCP